MSQFGTTNKERDLFIKVEGLEKALNFILNEMKDYRQKTPASVVSREGDQYTVEVKDKIIVPATLSNDNLYWREHGIPHIGDLVWVEHVKSQFHVVITERNTGQKFEAATLKKNAIASTKGKQ